MKLSKGTLEVLGNFSDINQSVLFKKGKTIRTVSPAKTVLAEAKVAEEFTREAAVYDLKQFLNYVSAFEDADVSFTEQSVKITNGKSSGKYMYAAKENISTPPDKDIVLPSVDIEFTMDKSMFSSVQKAASVLGLPEMILVGKSGKAFLTTSDSKNPSSHNFEYPIGEATGDYKMIFKMDNLKILPRDYKVKVSAKGIAHFASSTGDVQYWIATESTSTFESKSE
jgi:hypothetical protein